MYVCISSASRYGLNDFFLASLELGRAQNPFLKGGKNRVDYVSPSRVIMRVMVHRGYQYPQKLILMNKFKDFPFICLNFSLVMDEQIGEFVERCL
jgi:hypothetical protein